MIASIHFLGLAGIPTCKTYIKKTQEYICSSLLLLMLINAAIGKLF